MAVVMAIQHWRPYLLGKRFVVSTDQKSLKQLLEQKIVTAEQQNWAAKLLGYNFEIRYKPGKENRGADALSRMGEGSTLQTLISYPVKSTLIAKLLQEFHTTPQGGHSGFYRTYRRIAANLYWLGMKNVVQEFVIACDICQRQKYLAASPGGLLQPLTIPNRIWEDISIDFIMGLPKSRGFEAILVVVDRLSKYCHFIPLKHPYTACTVAEIFTKEVVRLHGVPASIERMKGLSDKGRKDRGFEIGEWVFVKLRAHRQQSVVTRINAKLAARFYGPYPKDVGEYQVEEQLPDNLSGDGNEMVEPEQLLANRTVQQQGEEGQQVLVKWKGKSAEEVTWEDMITMQSQFPQFCLADKAIGLEGGIDRGAASNLVHNQQGGPKQWIVYSRRVRKEGSKP
ncbi:transposon Ty3 gag-pol polyprotein [Trifolium pratense]|uniref:Transposon Ty3 gag-pol polyprotein n=1 Tax=Trifolium pratense TaxID=57577 RepID=A0A2K3P8M5_TRIPR|nr:transposon Ty3 gag-pol polyprotein [Trifolium pratense]